jgi:hypothetical protein
MTAPRTSRYHLPRRTSSLSRAMWTRPCHTPAGASPGGCPVDGFRLARGGPGRVGRCRRRHGRRGRGGAVGGPWRWSGSGVRAGRRWPGCSLLLTAIERFRSAATMSRWRSSAAPGGPGTATMRRSRRRPVVPSTRPVACDGAGGPGRRGGRGEQDVFAVPAGVTLHRAARSLRCVSASAPCAPLTWPPAASTYVPAGE